jgi:microcystin-dependent protein
MSRNRDYFQLTAHQRPMTGDTKTSVLLTDHLGWLLCDGRLLNVSDYPFLFGAIQYSFGSNGSTQFKLPNPAGRVPGFIGSGAGLTPDRRMGSNFGTETHTLTVAEMPTHNHGITDSGHFHTGTTDSAGYAREEATTAVLAGHQVADNSVGGHTHTFTTSNALTGITINNNGGSNAHNNMQPTLFLGNLFIYSGKFGKFSGALRTRYPFDSSGYPSVTSNYIV